MPSAIKKLRSRVAGPYNKVATFDSPDSQAFWWKYFAAYGLVHYYINNGSNGQFTRVFLMQFFCAF